MYVLTAPRPGAQSGVTYQFATTLGSLEDTMIDLVDTNGKAVIASNDDDERDTGATAGSLASYIEWTCPSTGTYYIMVEPYGDDVGTFSVSITQGTGMGADPCAGGAAMHSSAGAPSSSVVFEPESGLTSRRRSTVTLQHPPLTFRRCLNMDGERVSVE